MHYKFTIQAYLWKTIEVVVLRYLCVMRWEELRMEDGGVIQLSDLESIVW